jgi:hypothetical protein
MSPFLGSLALASGDDFRGLCQPSRRGNLILLVSSEGLEELYDVFKNSSLGSLLHSQFFGSKAFRPFYNLGALFN